MASKSGSKKKSSGRKYGKKGGRGGADGDAPHALRQASGEEQEAGDSNRLIKSA